MFLDMYQIFFVCLEEPLWMEVMVEVLLSLMSQPSHLGRTVATRALGLLAPHVTAPAVALITQVTYWLFFWFKGSKLPLLKGSFFQLCV